MPLLPDNVLARRERDDLVLRSDPLRVNWEFADLPTADGHALRITFTCSVRAVNDKTERRMLREVLLDGRGLITGEDVTKYFLPQLRATATRLAHQHPAPMWLDQEEPKRELVDGLKGAANAIAFACGLEVLAPFSAEVQSPTLERQKMRELQQAVAERQAAGQVEHFQRAAELLKQFQTLRAAAPELSPGRVLQQVSPADRGSMLQTLLMASARQELAQHIWAVAGPYLVRIDPRINSEGKVSPTPQLVPLPPTLGPLRSVQAAEIDGARVLMVGARSGVLLIRPDKPEEPTLFTDAGVETQHGFNRVVFWAERRQICGTHADAGIVCWDLDSPDAPRDTVRTAALAPTVSHATSSSSNTLVGYGGTYASYAGSMRAGGGTPGPRNLIALDDNALLFSIGGCLYEWDGKSAKALPIEFGSEVIAILPNDGQVMAACEDGTIASIDLGTRQVVNQERRASRIRAAGALPWLGSTRLLLAGDDGPVQCVGTDDPLVTQYASAYRGMRALAASADLVAGVSPDRQRLILWNSWEGHRPAAEIFLTSLTRHRIADIEMG